MPRNAVVSVGISWGYPGRGLVGFLWSAPKALGISGHGIAAPPTATCRYHEPAGMLRQVEVKSAGPR
jgi:hypothetical protein